MQVKTLDIGAAESDIEIHKVKERGTLKEKKKKFEEEKKP
jgi:hypothetical protein